ncbi:hypothetical protein [Noviherbaspirillum galbum]|uniref:Uncharacterized protein n=1 Tax=Noviherbaspirillum galbum TaxID=2709383 RepID=A0A6B3SN13_9BURK|nr:hypothetical protein [Noviherbaspirillum galbum]NEX60136.1 hypothetical protein [Noviherbaspirillum galbum]
MGLSFRWAQANNVPTKRKNFQTFPRFSLFRADLTDKNYTNLTLYSKKIAFLKINDNNQHKSEGSPEKLSLSRSPMSRPAIISEDVFSSLLRIARNQPVDIGGEVRTDDVLKDEVLGRRGYTAAQIQSALLLLARRNRIADLGRGLFRVAVPRSPVEGMAVHPVLRDLRISDEGIFFLQMSMLATRGACA